MSDDATTPKMEPPDVSVDLRYFVDAFIRIRDQKAELAKRHAEEMAPYNTALNTLEAAFLIHFQKTNSDNATIKGVGNVYRNTRKSAKISDPDAFRRHVIGAEAWDLLDLKANAPSVKAALDETGHPVPGVDYSETATIGVRRS